MKEHDIDDRGLTPVDPAEAQMHDATLCPECEGVGTLPDGETCPVCEGHGQGHWAHRRRLRFVISEK
jgi:DnaJ-class molecular chaperone